MRKYLWIFLGLFVFYACSKPIPKVTEENNKTVESEASVVVLEENTTSDIPIPVEVETVVTAQEEVVMEEFVPEHIKNSHIEVVEHY